MRCSRTGCGKEGDGKFCDECGAKMVDERMDTVVICSGKLEDDSPCGAELVLGPKFCKNCGSKIDQSLFTCLQNTCPECGKVLERDAKFCMECGYKLKKATSSGQSSTVIKEKDSTKSTDIMSGEEVMEPTRKDSEKTESQVKIVKEGITPTSDGTNSVHRVDGAVDNKNSEKLNEPRRPDGEDVMISEVCKSDLVNTVKSEVGKHETPVLTDSDVEMKSEAENETEMSKNDRQTAGNVSIIHESQNKDLSKKLEDVHIGRDVQGNLNIIDNTKSASDGNGSVKELNAITDETEIGNEDDVTKTQNVGNGQVKRSKSQKENEKKRKQETTEGVKEDKSCQQSKESHNKEKPPADPIVQKTTAENQGTAITDTEKGTHAERSDDEQNKSGNTKLSDIRQSPIEQEQVKGNETTEEDSNGNLLPSGNVQSTVNGKSSDDRKEENRTDENSKTSTSSSGKVFGAGRSIGMNQTGNNIEMKSPFGKELFTLDNKSKNEKTAEKDLSDSHRDKDKDNSTYEPVSPPDIEILDGKKFNNDFDMPTDEGEIEGTDVDNASTIVTRSMAKTKTDEKNKNKQQETSKKQSKVTDNKQKAAEYKSKERCIKVQFHVLTSEEFKFDPLKDKCILVFGTAELGGWKRTDRLMKDKRKIEPFVYEMIYEEVIPTRLIAGGQSVPYKYMVTKKDKPEKEVWEHYIKDKKAGVGINRDLTVSMRLKGLDIWHQFDCFMEHVPKSLKDKVFDYFNWRKSLAKSAERAIPILCPNIVEHDKSRLPIDEVIQLFKMASECMKKIYMVDGKCWYTSKDYSQFMGTTLMKAMVEKWKLDTTNTVSAVSAEQREQSTAAALTILYVSKALDLSMPDVKTIHVLTKALIMNVDSEKKGCPDLDLADRLFPEKRKLLLEAILKFVKNIMESPKDPCWLSLMTWVHFLSGQCVPFEPPANDVKHDSDEGKWWGLASIKTELGVFKNHYGKWAIPIEKMLKHLQPLFQMDYLLPRTLMAAVDLQDLHGLIQSGTIPVEVCLANLVFQLRIYKPTTFFHYESGSWRLPFMSSEEKVTQECVNTLLGSLQATFFSEDCSLTQWTMCYIIASDMLKESMYTKRTETIYFCVQILLHCIAMYHRVLSELKTESTKQTTDHLVVLRNACKEAVRWLETYYHRWNIYMKDILLVWDNVFAPVQLQSEEIRNMWNKDLSEALVINLQRKVCSENFHMKEFVQLYCQKVDEFNPYMQECMSKAAFLAIEKGYTLDYGNFTTEENRRFGMLLSNLFLAEWKKRVPSSAQDREQRMLRHTLIWPPFPQYLKIYYKDGKRIGMLTDECVQNLVQAVSVIEGRVTALLTGSLTIGDFNQITERDCKFPELAELLKDKKEHTAAFIRNAIGIRQKELEAFQIQAKQMATLTSVCTQLANVDRKCIDETLKKQEHLETYKVKDFCEPADVTKIGNIENYHPKCKAFNVSTPVLNMVPELHACYESSTFMMLWNAQCRDVYSQCNTLDDVMQNVWGPVKTRWDSLSNKIKTGEIKFKDFERLLGFRYRDSYDQMQTEMRAMNIPDRISGQRIDQLLKYRQLETCVRGAKTILRFAQEYNLKGDFTQIRVIATVRLT